jgi:hypothetical protein
LKAKIYAVLNAMEGMTTLNKLIEQLKKIDTEEEKQYEVLRSLYESEIKKILEGVEGPGESKGKKP